MAMIGPREQNRLVIGGLLAACVMSWIGGIALDEVHPLSEVPATAGSDTMMLIYVIIGFSILGCSSRYCG